MTELNFDGLVGPTHNYAGLAVGNLASTGHKGLISNPRAAALQGLHKMKRVSQLGALQAILPPHERPFLPMLRRLGFVGSDHEVLDKVAATDDHLLRLCSSASAMWTANAATVAPSADTQDGRVHITVANLSAMFHRSIEADVTLRVLQAIFRDTHHFCVHEPLPGGAHFADEGAANHTRLRTEQATVQLFGWGRRAWGEAPGPSRYPARQAYEASQAIARSHRLKPNVALLWQQSPLGIDGGAFHSDVLAVGNENLFVLHELAFVAHDDLQSELVLRLGAQLQLIVAKDAELPLPDAIRAYPFNSQIITKPNGRMVIIAPRESEECDPARLFLERVKAEADSVEEIVYLDVNASMNNGGGPACLRLRVELSDLERTAIGPRVLLDDALFHDLEAWISKHYRDQLALDDLSDPHLLNETRTALDELTQLLQLGSIYDFQNTPRREPCP